MEVFELLAIISIVIGYLNLWLIIKKEKPTIIINNSGASKSSFVHETLPDERGVSEIPMESKIVIKDLNTESSLNHETVSSSNIKELTDKIKKFRNL